MNRPGMSDSTFQPDRRVLDWPGDIAAVADRLSLERFAVLGYSGGGPYAAATAHVLAERVQVRGLVACVAHLEPRLEEGLHPNGLMLKRLCRERPRAARFLMTIGMGILTSSGRHVEQRPLSDSLSDATARRPRGCSARPAVTLSSPKPRRRKVA